MTKVLVVEDEPKVLQIMRYHFASAGLEGVYAPSADEGWRMLVTETPDVVVMAGLWSSASGETAASPRPL
jgi:DNA-binding response OmpR family regulator